MTGLGEPKFEITDKQHNDMNTDISARTLFSAPVAARKQPKTPFCRAGTPKPRGSLFVGHFCLGSCDLSTEDTTS